jgi:formamidopyrimidine-DNA glycosylase
MPELPDVTVYVEALRTRIIGHKLIQAQMRSPFLLRSTDPPLSATQGGTVRDVRRLDKRIAIGIAGSLWLVLHLKIAARLHWNTSAPKMGSRNLLAVFEFDNGWLWLTEAGTQRRASLHVVEGEAGLQSLSAGGIEPLYASLAAFTTALRSANHTLKRSLTDPHIFSGIGNAYSDEILYRAQLSPIAMTQKLTMQEVERLYDSTRATLIEWTERLRAESAGAFPEKVTAFRSDMAVHGCYGEPCPRCGARIQRIRYASNETNYCARCQTGGRLLADRAFSRLLHEDWPRTLDELEALKKR